MKKTIPVLCIVFCLLLALPSRFELSANAHSTNADPTTIVVSPSESIQAAINNATAGGTILVSAGIYNESLQIDKNISLIGEDADTTFINGQNSQFIVSIEADNVTIQGFTMECALNLNPASGISMDLFGGCTISNDVVENSQEGITLTSSKYNTITDNIITTNQQFGIASSSSLNNTISDNVITANSQDGISLILSNNNLLSGNTISNNYGGIYMYDSSDNVFSGNTFANNYPTNETISGICISNTFYDNNFYEAVQVSDNSNTSWDKNDQGNYWSDYLVKSPNATEVDGSGTGNAQYNITSNNVDTHPLMGEFLSFTATYVNEPYQVSIISNSTVSGFEFQVGTETGNEIIQLNATDVEDTVGFSRIAIPTGLMNTSSVIILIGDREIAPTWVKGQDTAFNYLYLTYSSGNQTILIISSQTMNLYDQLSAQFQTLNATYYELLSNYNAQFGLLSNESVQLQLFINYAAQLNNTYGGVLSNYTNLLGDYSQLQRSYQDLNASYQQQVSDDNQNLQNVRSLMYIFAAGTAVLILATVYFSKRTYSRPKEAPEKRESILSQPANSPVHNLA